MKMKGVVAMISLQLRDYLVAQGIATAGTDLFISLIPEGSEFPDNLIALFDETGFVPTEAQDYDVDVFGSQVIVRGDYPWAQAKMLEIHRAITAWSDQGSIDILSTHIQTEPAFLENDEKGRTLLTAHYEHYVNIGNNINRTPK